MVRKNNGFTVIELMIVIAVLAIGLALAIPSYLDIRNKRAVTNAAEQMARFLSVAQSESIKRNQALTVTINNNGVYCAGVDLGTAACDCRTAASCVVPAGGGDTTSVDLEMVLSGATFEMIQAPVLLDAGGNSTSQVLFTFDPVRGILDGVNQTSGTVQFTSDNGNFALDVDMALTGRIEICSRGSMKVGGFQGC